MGFLQNLMGGGKQELMNDFLQRDARIIDVRTSGEYRGGHVKGSKNIPLQELSKHLGKIKKQGKPVITCCASGARSGRAASMLRKEGIECINGGPWQSVQRAVNS